jgi:cyanate lyase
MKITRQQNASRNQGDCDDERQPINNHPLPVIVFAGTLIFCDAQQRSDICPAFLGEPAQPHGIFDGLRHHGSVRLKFLRSQASAAWRRHYDKLFKRAHRALQGIGKPMKLTKPLAAKAAELFGLGKAEQAMLNEVPLHGTPMPPTDPLIYRFTNSMMVRKALIEEEFGDGIMSAIDFDLEMERRRRNPRVSATARGIISPGIGRSWCSAAVDWVDRRCILQDQ